MVEADAVRFDLCVFRKEIHDGLHGDGFSGAGFSDEAEDFPGSKLQIDAANGLELFAAALKGDVKASDLEERSAGAVLPLLRRLFFLDIFLRAFTHLFLFSRWLPAGDFLPFLPRSFPVLSPRFRSFLRPPAAYPLPRRGPSAPRRRGGYLPAY